MAQQAEGGAADRDRRSAMPPAPVRFQAMGPGRLHQEGVPDPAPRNRQGTERGLRLCCWMRLSGRVACRGAGQVKCVAQIEVKFGSNQHRTSRAPGKTPWRRFGFVSIGFLATAISPSLTGRQAAPTPASAPTTLPKTAADIGVVAATNPRSALRCGRRSAPTPTWWCFSDRNTAGAMLVVGPRHARTIRRSSVWLLAMPSRPRPAPSGKNSSIPLPWAGSLSTLATLATLMIWWAPTVCTLRWPGNTISGPIWNHPSWMRCGDKPPVPPALDGWPDARRVKAQGRRGFLRTSRIHSVPGIMNLLQSFQDLMGAFGPWTARHCLRQDNCAWHARTGKIQPAWPCRAAVAPRSGCPGTSGARR